MKEGHNIIPKTWSLVNVFFKQSYQKKLLATFHRVNNEALGFLTMLKIGLKIVEFRL